MFERYFGWMDFRFDVCFNSITLICAWLVFMMNLMFMIMHADFDTDKFNLCCWTLIYMFGYLWNFKIVPFRQDIIEFKRRSNENRRDERTYQAL